MRSPPAIVLTSWATATASPPAALDLLDDRLGDLARGVLPRQAHPDVGHDDLGALRRARHRARPPDAAAGSGDHDRLVLEVPSHVACRSCLVGVPKSDGTLATAAGHSPAAEDELTLAGNTHEPRRRTASSAVERLARSENTF